MIKGRVWKRRVKIMTWTIWVTVGAVTLALCRQHVAANKIQVKTTSFHQKFGSVRPVRFGPDREPKPNRIFFGFFFFGSVFLSARFFSVSARLFRLGFRLFGSEVPPLSSVAQCTLIQLQRHYKQESFSTLLSGFIIAKKKIVLR